MMSAFWFPHDLVRKPELYDHAVLIFETRGISDSHIVDMPLSAVQLQELLLLITLNSHGRHSMVASTSVHPTVLILQWYARSHDEVLDWT